MFVRHPVRPLRPARPVGAVLRAAVHRLVCRERRRGRRPCASGPGPGPALDEMFAARVRGELVAALPDEDLGQELDDCLDTYVLGSKPRCEEVEYLELVQDAIDRIERGR
ncbi:hypothetical protein ACFP1Z_16770 [Streptomyces gamaensis]|uniref:CdiI immunity protein domain-containing protein n=1 Tax=Streptomyces gamaensis TaxID=1763542 RepID=A0ABW0Z060_9ACTN